MNVPPGYERLLLAHAVAVARSDVMQAIRSALVGADGSRKTLYEYASAAPGARQMRGRGVAYCVTLPGGRPVVIRHNRHGGMLARITGDRFFAPTRAPRELDVALELERRGIPTPHVLGYALYPPGGLLQRADVATAEIPAGRDLAQCLAQSHDAGRAAALDSTAGLVAALARAGIRHPDLNARNVLVTADRAYVLDVDRISLDENPDSALEQNLRRLAQSLRKLNQNEGLRATEAEIDQLASVARQRIATP